LLPLRKWDIVFLHVPSLVRKGVRSAAGPGWARLELQAGLVGPARISTSIASRAFPRVPHFQLVTIDGLALGAHELDRLEAIPGSVIDTGPNEPNLRIVRELYTGNDDREMHFTVLVVERAD
jgi:hypothetical protein